MSFTLVTFSSSGLEEIDTFQNPGSAWQYQLRQKACSFSHGSFSNVPSSSCLYQTTNPVLSQNRIFTFIAGLAEEDKQVPAQRILEHETLRQHREFIKAGSHICSAYSSSARKTASTAPPPSKDLYELPVGPLRKCTQYFRPALIAAAISSPVALLCPAPTTMPFWVRYSVSRRDLSPNSGATFTSFIVPLSLIRSKISDEGSYIESRGCAPDICEFINVPSSKTAENCCSARIFFPVLSNTRQDGRSTF